MWMSIISTLLLLTTSTFVRSALAKNSTNDTTPSCDWSTKIDPKINSTGRYEFTWDSSYATNDPWYVSVLVIAPVQGQSTEVGARAYISVPKNVSSDTRLCMYQFVNINATLEAGGRNSCNGAISATCIEYLTDALDKTETIYCPNYFAQSDEFAKACPMLAEGSSIRSTEYIDVTNNGTCRHDPVPEMQIPDGYNTFRTMSDLNPFPHNIATDYPQQAYELLTRQTIPLVFLGRFVDQKPLVVGELHTAEFPIEFACLVANKAAEGSRVADKEKPWESTAAGASAQKMWWVTTWVVAVVLAL